jgi:putative glycosyltransferase
MKLSIVATLYCSAAHILEFYERSTKSARQLVGEDYEIVLVNDGSPDDSLEIAVKLTETDPKVLVVDLSRNFGHHKAMMTGLANASGETIFLIDSDLEEEPEWLLDFDRQMQVEKCDVVYGVQKYRKGGVFEYWSGHCFYALFNLLTNMDLPENTATARLMKRCYVDALLRHEEREVFMPGLWHITGFKQSSQEIKKHHTSTSTYTLRKKIALFINAATAFSNVPLIGTFYIGIFIVGISIIYICFLIFHWLFSVTPVSGWTSVIASVWLLGGLIMSSIGVIGIYLSKIFSEVKRRPYTITRNIYRHTVSPGQ